MDQHWVALIIFVLVFLISISALIFFKKMPLVEKYTAQVNVPDALEQGACSAIDPKNFANSGPDPDPDSEFGVVAKQNADNYLATGRFKQWKPLALPPDATDNDQYCYVNTQDYYMSGHACDRDDPNFANVPFIKDVFADDNAQTTTTAIDKKCVFRIDKAQVTPDSLLNFWDNVSAPTECTKQFRHLLDLTQSLRKQKKALARSNAELDATIKTKETALGHLQNDIKDKSGTKHALENTYSDCNMHLSSLLEQNDAIQQAIHYAETHCTERLNGLETGIAACTEASNAVLGKYTPLAASLSQLQTDMSGFQIKYDGLQNDININTSMLTNVQSTYNKKKTAYETLQASYAQCATDLKTCNTSLDTCHEDLKTRQKYAVDMQANYDACKPPLDVCDGKLKTCNSLSSSLEKSINKYTGLLADCVNKKAKCLTDDARAVVSIQGLNQDYIFAQQYYNYTDCTAFQQQVDALSAQEADLLARCKRIEVLSDQAQNELKDAVSSQNNQLSSTLKSCQTSVAAATAANSVTQVLIERHFVTCPDGQSCPITDDADAQAKCDTNFCQKYIPGKGAVYAGSWLSLDNQQSGCFCSYQGVQMDVAIANAANEKAMKKGGDVLPVGPYSTETMTVNRGPGLPAQTMPTCVGCAADNYFLSCQCYNATAGTWSNATLDYMGCSKPVKNTNGVLTCG
jgi:predicted  nucleic acid-binding Zn-ribbon protein